MYHSLVVLKDMNLVKIKEFSHNCIKKFETILNSCEVAQLESSLREVLYLPKDCFVHQSGLRIGILHHTFEFVGEVFKLIVKLPKDLEGLNN